MKSLAAVGSALSWILLLLAVTISGARASTLDDRVLPVACNICKGNNTLINGDITEFTMANGLTWTCEYLQETVQDVQEDGAWGEAQQCWQAQLQAEVGECECLDANPDDDEFDGSVLDEYVDLHNACNMCAGQELPEVPASMEDAVVDTQVMGTQSCSGLYFAMMEGIISANLCPTIQAVAGPACCHELVASAAARTAPLLRGAATGDLPS